MNIILTLKNSIKQERIILILTLTKLCTPCGLFHKHLQTFTNTSVSAHIFLDTILVFAVRQNIDTGTIVDTDVRDILTPPPIYTYRGNEV